MALRQQLAFHGILLYRKHYREHDMLVKFMTAELGTKMFLIRGATRPRYKMRADILPFTYGIYTGNFSQRGLSYLKNALTTHHYLSISRNIDLNAYATYIMGLIDAAFPDGVRTVEWFKKLYYGLALIDRDRDPEVVTDIFEIQLLKVFGVEPNLRNCAVCGKVRWPMDFSEQYGGLLCCRHWNRDPHRFHLDSKTVRYLQFLSQVSLQTIDQIRVSMRTKLQLRRLLDSLYNDWVGLRLKSKRFLDQMHRFHF